MERRKERKRNTVHRKTQRERDKWWGEIEHGQEGEIENRIKRKVRQGKEITWLQSRNMVKCGVERVHNGGRCGPRGGR